MSFPSIWERALPRWSMLLALVLAAMVVVAACSDDDDDDAADPDADPPVTETDDGETDGDTDDPSDNGDTDGDTDESDDPADGDTGDDTGDAGDDDSGDPAPQAQDVQFTTRDGLTLTATQWAAMNETSTRWILLGHQNGASRADWLDVPGRFASADFHVLAWDFRGFGGSDDGEVEDITLDWLAAVEYAAAQGATAIYGVGASMGGTSLLDAAAQDDRITAIVTVSAPSNFSGIDAVAAAANVTVPVLLFAGDADDGYVAQAGEIAAAATGETETVSLATSLHGNALISDAQFFDQITGQVLVHFGVASA